MAEVEASQAIVREASDVDRARAGQERHAAKTMTLPGGLYVMGTERHESRRIDNQLRGRSGRQGDPGRTKFYLSLEDDLMRIFAADRIDGMLQKLGLQKGEAIISPWINKALENAQKKVEARNFDSRKHVLKYDDVMNDQRKVDVRAAPRHHGHRGRLGDRRRHAPSGAGGAGDASTSPRTPMPSSGTSKASRPRSSASSASSCRSRQWADEEGIADQEIRERLIKEVDAKFDGDGRRSSAPRS